MILLMLAVVMVAVVVFIIAEFAAYKTPDIKWQAHASRDGNLFAIHQWVKRLERDGKFNGTVVIADGSEIILHANAGFTDWRRDKTIGDRTSFNLASVSKHMTAFALLMLAYEKKLSRTDLIVRTLPELAHYRAVTIDHLLYHTSGIADYVRLLNGRYHAPQYLTPNGLISALSDVDLHFVPGEKERYSNSNYVLLAEIIARVSGMSFARFMGERVFGPLGMDDTAVVNLVENTMRLEDRAYGFRRKYIHAGRPIVHDLNYLDGVAGDSNIYASARDLVKWDASLRDGALLPADYYEQAYVAHRLNNGDISTENWWGTPLQSGLGWNVQDMPVVTTYGAWQGASNYYRRDLERDTVLVVLSNSGFFLRTASIGEKLADAVSKL